jgi:formylmethanofuran dehydrogenase subunit E
MSSVALAVAPMLPLAMAEAAPPVAVAVTAEVRHKAWAVGVSDDWNWDVIRAATEHEAKILWCAEQGFGTDCEEDGEEDCDCEFCSGMANADVLRQEEWDGIDVRAGDAHWFASGLGAHCDRCSGETFIDGDGRLIGESIVCEACMTIEDWDSADSEYAADLREAAE